MHFHQLYFSSVPSACIQVPRMGQHVEPPGPSAGLLRVTCLRLGADWSLPVFRPICWFTCLVQGTLPDDRDCTFFMGCLHSWAVGSQEGVMSAGGVTECSAKSCNDKYPSFAMAAVPTGSVSHPESRTQGFHYRYRFYSLGSYKTV